MLVSPACLQDNGKDNSAFGYLSPGRTANFVAGKGLTMNLNIIKYVVRGFCLRFSTIDDLIMHNAWGCLC